MRLRRRRRRWCGIVMWIDAGWRRRRRRIVMRIDARWRRRRRRIVMRIDARWRRRRRRIVMRIDARWRRRRRRIVMRIDARWRRRRRRIVMRIRGRRRWRRWRRVARLRLMVRDYERGWRWRGRQRVGVLRQGRGRFRCIDSGTAEHDSAALNVRRVSRRKRLAGGEQLFDLNVARRRHRRRNGCRLGWQQLDANVERAAVGSGGIACLHAGSADNQGA